MVNMTVLTRCRRLSYTILEVAELFLGYISEVNVDEGELYLDVIDRSPVGLGAA